MKKAVLVIDMPENCKECHLKYDFESRYICTNPKGKYRIDVTQYVKNETKPDWCPLKEIPEKKEIAYCYTQTDYIYRDGWNNCLNKILD